jgi:hypothetical protein
MYIGNGIKPGTSIYKSVALQSSIELMGKFHNTCFINSTYILYVKCTLISGSEFGVGADIRVFITR